VRTWHGWYRYITLSMLTSAFLAVTAARERTIPDGPGDAAATASQKGTHQLWTTSPAADPKVWFGRRT
jgi:hypothetical protein